MLHKDAGVGDNHVIQHWEVADEAARLALVVTAADVGRVCRQLDTNVFWILNDDSPVTWLGPVGSPGPTGPAGAPGADGPTGPAGPAFTGGTLTSALNEAPIVTLPSAATVDIGAAAANSITISGTTAITSLGTIAAGARRLLRFSGILTLTHNATSLIIPGGANITTAAGDIAEMLSLGSGNWVCVSYVRANGAAIVGGGGLSSFTEFVNTTTPNTSIPAIGLAINNPASSADLVVNAKGNAAICRHVPDNTATGGNKRGTWALDLQVQRTTATQVASGTRALLLGGYNNTASGNNSAVLTGNDNSSTGERSAVLGGVSNTASGVSSTVLGGSSNTASGNGVVVHGNASTSRGTNNSYTHGSTFNSTLGVSQYRRVLLFNQTTNATPVQLLADGGASSASNRLDLPVNSMFFFSAIVTAKVNGGDTATYRIEGVAKRFATAASIVFEGTPTVVTLFAAAGAAPWVVAVSLNTTTGTLHFDVTGEAGRTIAWLANVKLTELIA